MITTGKLKLYWNWLLDFALACWATYRGAKSYDVDLCMDGLKEAVDGLEDAVDYLTDDDEDGGDGDMDIEDFEIECDCEDGEECWVCCDQDED